MEFRIIPIGLEHARLEVVRNDGGRNPAKITEGIFQTAQEAFTGLPPDHFAISLARIREHRPKQMGATALVIFDHPGALAEIHLHLLPRRTLHASEGQFLSLHPAQHKAAHRKITAGKLPFGHQVLINPLDGQTPLQRRFDLFPPRVTQAGRTGNGDRAGLRVAGRF